MPATLTLTYEWHFKELSYGLEKKIGRRERWKGLESFVGIRMKFIAKKLSISRLETRLLGEKTLQEKLRVAHFYYN
jgi:hypothetical protein